MATGFGRARKLRDLASEMRSMHALVVFDNCELMSEEVKEVAGILLEGSTTLGVLATAVSPLGSPNEHVYALPPLAVPPIGNEMEVLRSLNSDAIALFCERAQAARADFTLSPENVVRISEISRAVNGNPLAIEIAASRIGARGIRGVGANITHLKIGSPLRPHHQSINAALEYAEGLLRPEAAALLPRIAMFASSFSFEDASDAWLTNPSEAEDLSDRMGLLVEAGWLILDISTSLYSIAPLVQSYANAGHAGDRTSAECEYCSWVFRLLGRAAAASEAKGESSALAMLDGRFDDIERACLIALGRPELHDQLRAAALPIPEYCARRNLLPRAESLFRRLLESLRGSARNSSQILKPGGRGQDDRSRSARGRKVLRRIRSRARCMREFA